MVLIGLLPLSLAFVITYLEERQAIRDAIGRDFRQIAIEAAGKIELQVMRGVSEARQLATIPILRGAVIDSNRSYVGRDHAAIGRIMREWERRWAMRPRPGHDPGFINKKATDYLHEWVRIPRSENVADFLTDALGAPVGRSTARGQDHHIRRL